MILKHPARRALVVLGILPLLLLPTGCIFSPEGGKGKDEDTRVPERTSVRGTIDLFRFVWEYRRLDLYEQLLHEEFEYVPQDADVEDLPWIGPDDPWVRTDELLMAANMFNPQFVSDETGASVQSIQMDLTITNERTVPEGVEVRTNADILVLWAEGTGAQSVVRFDFIVVEDPDEPGLFQILRQVELSDHEG